MDNDATTNSSRQGRQRRRLIAGVVGAAVIAGAEHLDEAVAWLHGLGAGTVAVNYLG